MQPMKHYQLASGPTCLLNLKEEHGPCPWTEKVVLHDWMKTMAQALDWT